MKRKILFAEVLFFIWTGTLFSQESYKILPFSGREWIIKEAKRPVGPGPNLFSFDSISMEGDAIRLSVIKKGRRWYAAELYSADSFGFGSYTLDFSIPRRLDHQLVFGFFLYNDNIPPYFNEIDLELSRWGSSDNHPFSFSVQPYDVPGNSFSFYAVDQGRFEGRIVWTPEYIEFSLYSLQNGLLEHWRYEGGGIPAGGDVKVHFNLWLFNGIDPGEEGPFVADLHSFHYNPIY